MDEMSLKMVMVIDLDKNSKKIKLIMRIKGKF